MKTSRIIGLLFLFPFSLIAQTVPPLVNYQGQLASTNGLLTNGTYQLTFNVWDAATNGTNIWGPQIFDGGTGTGHGAMVPVAGGNFNVMLGPYDTNNRFLANA